MPRFTNSIIQVSGSGDFETQIQKLYNKLRLESSSPPNNLDNVLLSSEKTPKDYNYSNILTDGGSGRVSSGLKSLELLSILCSGTEISNLFLFDNVIYVGTVNQFKTYNDDKLTELVIANLGMELIVSELADSTVEAFRSKCLLMGKDVKVGVFSPDTYRKYIISECKRLTRLYLRKKNQTV